MLSISLARMRGTLPKKQHCEVEALFKKALATEEPTERMKLFMQIDRDLHLHSIIEEEIFYPEVKRRELAALSDLVQHHVDEEEGTMFKMAHHSFDKAELEAMGSRMEEAYAQATVPA